MCAIEFESLTVLYGCLAAPGLANAKKLKIYRQQKESVTKDIFFTAPPNDLKEVTTLISKLLDTILPSVGEDKYGIRDLQKLCATFNVCTTIG